MPNLKITAMPSLGGNQVPTDLVTAVDLSEAPVNQNVKSTLNDLFATITKNITDRAIRFQAPGSAPAVAATSQGALYHNGTAFLASSNGGAYAPLLSLSPQADHAVLIGPTTGGPSAPTWRGLTLSDLPAIATNRLLGRVSPSSPGDVEEIAPGAGVLTWIQTPTVSNLAAAASVSITGNTVTGSWVFSDSPSLVSPRITSDLYTNTNRIILGLSQNGLSTDYLRIENSPASFVNGPLIESVGTSADVNFRIRSKGLGRIQLLTANAVTVSNLSASSGATLEIQDGTVTGARIVIGNLTFNSPLGGFGFYTLPTADGTSGQALITDGAGGLSWTSVLSLTPQADHAVLIGPTSGGPTAPTWRGLTLSDLPTIATNRLLGRVSLSSGDVEQITPGAGVLTWIQTPTADNLRSAVTGDTGTGNLVFADAPTITSPTVSSGNLTFSGSAQRIFGVFNYAAQFSDNTIFQSLASESNTILNVVPNTATNLNAGIRFASNPNGGLNGNSGQFLLSTGNEFRINSFSNGTGTTRPIRFMTDTVTRVTIEPNSNIGFNSTTYGTGSIGVIAIGDATVTPGSFPGIGAGGILYVSAGALRWRGPSTDTQIAPA